MLKVAYVLLVFWIILRVKKVVVYSTHGGVSNVRIFFFFFLKKSEQGVAMIKEDMLHHDMVSLHVSIATLRCLGVGRILSAFKSYFISSPELPHILNP